MRYTDKLAFAEGYHAGISGTGYEQQYEAYDLCVQFDRGYECGRARLMNQLEDQLTKLEETV